MTGASQSFGWTRARHGLLLGGLLLAWAAEAQAAGLDPFKMRAVAGEQAGGPVAILEATVPPGHFLYADHLVVTARPPAVLRALDPVAPVRVFDKFTEEEKSVFTQNWRQVYAVDAAGDAGAVDVLVEYQGCDQEMCFFPQKKSFSLQFAVTETPAPASDATMAAAPAAESAAAGVERAWTNQLANFRVGGTAAGYLATEKFLDFIATATGERAAAGAIEKGMVVTLILILLGGLGLNLTPCVLPLIPINLAILGAGAQARSKGQGFALGGAYGLAMAVTYGALGLVVVLTGAKFGSLNASPWFNGSIALIFAALALAMLDLFEIDLSRFQSRVTPGAGRKGSLLLAFFMGVVSALLAGACVAPVVIWVLLLAGRLYAQGHGLALMLPFVLGLGMAIPWPFMGAGLSLLPKPGAWMTRVKQVFAAVIFLFAAYYGYQAYEQFQERRGQQAARAAGGTSADEPTRLLAEGLRRAQAEQKPVFIDFWATWCKNCLAMDATTFKDPAVRERLDSMVVIKYQAELPNDPPAKDVLDHFEAIGLPTYVVLLPPAP